jgi:UDP-N-acetylmuramyl pentapeptide synthase
MDELTSICVPDVSILTSIDSVHAENFVDGKDGIYKEKIKLLAATQDIIVIHDSIVIDDSVKQNKTVIQYSDIE